MSRQGMANEKTVAAGIYHYLSIVREHHAVAPRVPHCRGRWRGLWMHAYEQSGDKGYLAVYGFRGRDTLNQGLAHVVAEDRCVARPNVCQHRMEAFELADTTKPGYWKILCFILVDPHARILSTSDVPP